ncbi:hypothetical protein JW859_05990 [bacterium]|nr:hypothetical protein [bacterium]
MDHDATRSMSSVNAELDELREQLRILRNELSETKAFFRGVTDELVQQVRELKAHANSRDSGIAAPPRLIPQR